MACSKHSMEAPVGQVVGGKPGGRGKGQDVQGCGGPGEQLGFYSNWNGRPCWILSSCVKDRKRRHRVAVSSFQKSQTGEVEDQAYSRSQCPAVLPLPPGSQRDETWGVWGTTDSDGAIILCAGIRYFVSQLPLLSFSRTL